MEKRNYVNRIFNFVYFYRNNNIHTRKLQSQTTISMTLYDYVIIQIARRTYLIVIKEITFLFTLSHLRVSVSFELCAD